MLGALSTLESEQRIVLLLILSLAVALLAGRFRVPYTLALVLVGLLLGSLDLLPGFQLEPDLVLFIFIPALLFEGAWSIDVAVLRHNWLAVFLLAVPGLLFSLGVVAVVMHIGAGLSWLLALLLGAIVSPTDPIAVVALLRQLGMPERLRTIVEGESLFNDGVGAAAYTLVRVALLASLGLSRLSTAFPGGEELHAIWLVLGGPLLGAGIALVVARLQRNVDDYLIETALTFSVAYGVYLLAEALHASGLLAVVGAGLVLGSYGRRTGMSERTREVVDDVWEFAGYLANSLLFLLLGVQIGGADLIRALGPILWAVLAVIGGRAVMVFLVFSFHDNLARTLARRRATHWFGLRHGLLPVPRQWRPLILLSGLRGALSLALVLSLPAEIPQLEQLRLVTYGVVLVTLVGQGLGMRLLLPHWPHVEADADLQQTQQPARHKS
ncbi:MAG TPA: sodium:proton antiporter [Ktedonobacterales bacterium]|nr:sodium:proton antiporter [Ktedonobacterales bacterium]